MRKAKKRGLMNKQNEDETNLLFRSINEIFETGNRDLNVYLKETEEFSIFQANEENLS